MPPRGAGPALMGTRGWFQRFGSSSFEFLLAESDSVERSDNNVLQGTRGGVLEDVLGLEDVLEDTF